MLYCFVSGPYWKNLVYCKNGILAISRHILANYIITFSKSPFVLLIILILLCYSLKTSKVTYLDEAFQFYTVIKSRGYYKDADRYSSGVS